MQSGDIEKNLLAPRMEECGTYPAIMSEENGVTLYVSVNHTLCVEDRQRLQDRQTHCGNLLLVHPAEWRYVSLDF